MSRLAVVLPAGQILILSRRSRNRLVKMIVEELCPRVTPGGKIIYVGDTSGEWALFDEVAFAKLGILVDLRGDMPDVVIHDVKRDWLFLIQAVTSRGPVDSKRRQELASRFKGSTAGLVYVTAFLSRKAMGKHLEDISWETEVWVADAPDHMIHFNGNALLGPAGE